jgi:hypothetical protein
MYAIYVNDIFYVTDSVKCVLYADDTAIVVSAESVITLLNLSQHYFTLFSNWFAANKLSLNDSKTHFVIFGLSKNIHDCDSIVFDRHTVKRVHELRYLGIVIDDVFGYCN